MCVIIYNLFLKLTIDEFVKPYTVKQKKTKVDASHMVIQPSRRNDAKVFHDTRNKFAASRLQ